MYQRTKKTLAKAMALALALGLPGTGGSMAVYADETDNTAAQETAKAEHAYAELPDSYFITYEVTDEDGIITEVTKAVDANGNVYYKTADEEALYCLESGNYTLYLKENGVFTAQEGKQYTKEYIEEATAGFDDFVEQANFIEDYMDAEQAGETVVAERPCTIYTAVRKIFNYKVQYEYAVDQQTGVCLSWGSKKEISGHEKKNQESFACTRFDTEITDLTLELLADSV